MKLYGPDKSMLMEIQSISEHPEGLLIEGKIMGAMPMKAVLRPSELRGGRKLIGMRLAWHILRMLFQRDRSKS
ncbi:hypothetical protein ASE00_01445 [Sphingomonas sp. Root710]|uniref:hypothetical protein n=1 Tax=Sphingomonas sp. Root710 TaxID=1736594 RepID=UPI0006F8C61A|nr:hypothetical protein [Sphingomonas sp. Root710]KRB85488.1 hypothetical protein ASE00_01445 [Sphingomonas sp. Root710]